MAGRLMISVESETGWVQLQCVPCALAGRVRTWHAPTTDPDATAAAVRSCVDHGQIEHGNARQKGG